MTRDREDTLPDSEKVVRRQARLCVEKLARDFSRSLAGADAFHMKLRFLASLGEAAVFAASLRALNHCAL